MYACVMYLPCTYTRIEDQEITLPKNLYLHIYLDLQQ